MLSPKWDFLLLTRKIKRTIGWIFLYYVIPCYLASCLSIYFLKTSHGQNPYSGEHGPSPSLCTRETEGLVWGSWIQVPLPRNELDVLCSLLQAARKLLSFLPVSRHHSLSATLEPWGKRLFIIYRSMASIVKVSWPQHWSEPRKRKDEKASHIPRPYPTGIFPVGISFMHLFNHYKLTMHFLASWMVLSHLLRDGRCPFKL